MAYADKIETTKDIGTNPADVVERWVTEHKLADEAMVYKNARQGHKNWMDRAGDIVAAYRDEEKRRGKNKFNILYSNTETLMPALYAQTPTPDVRRKNTDSRVPDAVGRETAVVLEQMLKVGADDPDTDFHDVMLQCVQDYVLPGRGVARVRYIPTLGPTENEKIFVERTEQTDELSGDLTARYVGDVEGERTEFPAEEVQTDDAGNTYVLGENVFEPVLWEETRTEYVQWRNFRHSPAKTWKGVRWVSFEDKLTRDELKEQFGERGKKCPLDWTPDSLKDRDNYSDEQLELFKKATVWEIWDRIDRKVYVICPAYKEEPLAEWDDPLGLEGFFPCPRPLIFGRTNDSLVPVPMYLIYQDQAAELNKVTMRIDRIVSAIKAAGLYAGKRQNDIESLLKSADNTLIPVAEWMSHLQSGGLKGAIDWLPLDQFAQTLEVLINQRLQIKQTIFEITGISDIMRGQTDPQETKGAQVLKTQFGNLRIQHPRAEVERFARDLFRLQAEVMAEKFGDETIKAMSGSQLPTQEEKAQAGQMAQQLKQQMQGGQQQPDPAVGKQLKKMEEVRDRPTWDQVLALLRDQGARGFRIDVETNSTVLPDAFEEQQHRTEFLTAITQFVQAVGPGVQQGLIPVGFAKAMLMFGVRGFKVGREIEQSLEDLDEMAASPPQQEQQQGMSPEELALEEKKIDSTAQRDERKAQIDERSKQRDFDLRERELDLKEQEIGIKRNDSDRSEREFQGSEAAANVVQLEQVRRQASAATDAASQAAETVAQAVAQLSQVMQQLSNVAEELARPKNVKVVRDQSGRIQGAEVS